MLSSTVDRVRSTPAAHVNQRIPAAGRENIDRAALGGAGKQIERALCKNSTKEWDVERALEANAGVRRADRLRARFVADRRFFALPALSAPSCCTRAAGWCPPLPIMRRLGNPHGGRDRGRARALKAMQAQLATFTPPAGRARRGGASELSRRGVRDDAEHEERDAQSLTDHDIYLFP